jgi:hypothetical protein
MPNFKIMLTVDVPAFKEVLIEDAPSEEAAQRQALAEARAKGGNRPDHSWDVEYDGADLDMISVNECTEVP